MLLGLIDVRVKYADQERILPLLVAPGSNLDVMGRNWLATVQLNWEKIRQRMYLKEISTMPAEKNHSHLSEILQKYGHMFKEELGTLKGTTAKIHLKEGFYALSASKAIFRVRTKARTRMDQQSVMRTMTMTTTHSQTSANALMKAGDLPPGGAPRRNPPRKRCQPRHLNDYVM